MDVTTRRIARTHRRTFADVENGRDNNFNLIRMTAAVGVLVSHAYPIALGPQAAEPLEDALQGISLGRLSVVVFFAISGFLIARSFCRGDGIARFVTARALRIMPALIALLVLTVVVAGVVTTAQPRQYWPAAFEYVLRNVTLYRPVYPLPGIFTDNAYGPDVNGSLWTLRHEVTCYVGILLLGSLGVLRSRLRMAVALTVFLSVYWMVTRFAGSTLLVSLAGLAFPFMLGAAMYVCRDRLPLSPTIGISLAAAAALSQPTSVFGELVIVAVSYNVFLLAYLPSGWIRRYNRLGDYSYGTYLYAFPIQQIVASSTDGNAFTNIALALPPTLVCAAASWHLVERPALDVAHMLSDRTRHRTEPAPS